MDDSALANKLTALALAVTDATRVETEDLGASDVAALLAISAHEPVPVVAVARAVGLTHSAAVRLVDRLERAWLVQRRRRIAREVLVETTARGHRRAEAIAAARLGAAASFTSGLDPRQKQRLGALIDAIILARSSSRELQPPFDAARHCRFCSLAACDCGLHPKP
jgi:DNA-binding MarR family transcriptional regulator